MLRETENVGGVDLVIVCILERVRVLSLRRHSFVERVGPHEAVEIQLIFVGRGITILVAQILPYVIL